jgi:hypothetical protein
VLLISIGLRLHLPRVDWKIIFVVEEEIIVSIVLRVCLMVAAIEVDVVRIDVTVTHADAGFVELDDGKLFRRIETLNSSLRVMLKVEHDLFKVRDFLAALQDGSKPLWYADVRVVYGE